MPPIIYACKPINAALVGSMTENNIFCRKRTESSRMFPFLAPGIRVLYMIFCIYPTKNPPVGDGEKGRKAIPLGGFRSGNTRVKIKIQTDYFPSYLRERHAMLL